MTSGILENAASSFLNTAEIPIFDPISKTFQGFVITFVAVFSPAVAQFSPKFLINLPKPSAASVLFLTINNVFLSRLRCLPFNNLRPVLVISPTVIFVKTNDTHQHNYTYFWLFDDNIKKNKNKTSELFHQIKVKT